jgi:hypothetical protein
MGTFFHILGSGVEHEDNMFFRNTDIHLTKVKLSQLRIAPT